MWLDTLNKIKRQSGKTTEQISEESGIPRGTLNKLFAGQTKDPQYGTLKAVVKCLGCTVDDLEKNPYDGRAILELEIIKKYRHLDDHGKEMVDMVLDKEYDRCVNPPQIHTLKVAARGGGVFEVPIDRPFTDEDERELNKIAAESMEENKDL